jgi:phage-related protein
MEWRIEFYSDKVLKQIQSLPVGIKANFYYITKLMKEFGPNLGRPHTAPLKNGLFEIRAKGKEGISRSFFLFYRGKDDCDTSFHN